MAHEVGVEILPGVRVYHRSVRVPVGDPVQLAAILSRACSSETLDETIRLLLATPDRFSEDVVDAGERSGDSAGCLEDAAMVDLDAWQERW